MIPWYLYIDCLRYVKKHTVYVYANICIYIERDSVYKRYIYNYI